MNAQSPYLTAGGQIFWQLLYDNGKYIREAETQESIRTAKRGAVALDIVEKATRLTLLSNDVQPYRIVVRVTLGPEQRPVFYRRRFSEISTARTGLLSAPLESGLDGIVFGRVSAHVLDSSDLDEHEQRAGFNADLWMIRDGKITDCTQPLIDAQMIALQAQG